MQLQWRALPRPKRSALDCLLDKERVTACAAVGFARQLGLSLEVVPPTLFLVDGDVVVECQLLPSISSTDCAFVDERHIARLDRVSRWTCRLDPPLVPDEWSWDVVLVTFRRGCVAEAVLCAAMPRSWEKMVTNALVDRVTQKHDSGTLMGPGFCERFSIECIGSEKQVSGRVTDVTQVRFQRLRRSECRPRCELLTDALANGCEGVLLVEVGSEEPKAVRAALDRLLAGRTAYHVSAVDVVCGRIVSALGERHVTVLWRLEEVCSSEDDPDEVKSATRTVTAWLQHRPRVAGDCLIAVVRSVTKLTLSVRALFSRAVFSLGATVRDPAIISKELELALCEAMGVDGAKAALVSLLLRDAANSLVLVGPAGTGKSLLCSACVACFPCVRGTLDTLVQCYIGESERALASLFASARQGHALVVLDDVDTLLRGPTGRGLELQLARELQRGGCRVLLTCRVLDSALAALVGQVVVLGQPDGAVRHRLLERFCANAGVLDELVQRTDHFSHAECVRLGRLAELCSGTARATAMSHFETALESFIFCS